MPSLPGSGAIPDVALETCRSPRHHEDRRRASSRKTRTHCGRSVAVVKTCGAADLTSGGLRASCFRGAARVNKRHIRALTATCRIWPVAARQILTTRGLWAVHSRRDQQVGSRHTRRKALGRPVRLSPCGLLFTAACDDRSPCPSYAQLLRRAISSRGSSHCASVAPR